MSSAGIGVADAPLPASALVRSRGRDHRFFTGMATAVALTAFIGFAPTYYLRGAFGGRPLSALVHLHGAIFTAWICSSLLQTSLVAVRRTDLHRRLGVWSAPAGDGDARGRLPHGGGGGAARRDSARRSASDRVPRGPDGHAGGVRVLLSAGARSAPSARDPQAADAARHHPLLTPAIARFAGSSGSRVRSSRSAAPASSWWPAWSTTGCRTAGCIPPSSGAAWA